MIILAGLNPRTAKAQGGTRVAALQVISGVLEDPKLATQLASWAYDIIQLCQRALKSSGNGEPTYRIAAVQTACSVVIASRLAFLKTRSIDQGSSGQLLLKGALEDKAIFEMVKLLKLGLQDKFPEVRSETARLASLMAPMVINTHVKSPSSPDAIAATPTTTLEDVMTIAFKNLDDESPHVAASWAEALARLMSTSIEYQNQMGSERAGNRDVEGGTSGGPGTASLSNRGPRKGVLPASACNTLPKALKYLVSVFIKVGGELQAPRAGGSFSVGGRAVRVGFARAIIQLMRLQATVRALGEGRSMSYKESILIILSMVGSDMEAQLRGSDRGGAPPVGHLDATTVVTSRTMSSVGAASSSTQSGRALFGQGPKASPADACVARSLASLVFREGLSKLAAEANQLAILHELINLCTSKQGALKGDQLQVLLVESSHLFATLGEATTSSLVDIVGALKNALRHPDHGVRHEAAVACASLVSVFPSEGRKMLRDTVNAIQIEHAEFMSVASTQTANDSPGSLGAGRFLFGRAPQGKEAKADETLKHQYAIHGLALMVSMIVRDLPTLPGGLPLEILNTVMSVSEILVSTVKNDALKEASPSGTCTCVRAGFGIICGVLTTGPTAVAEHIAGIFGLWQLVTSTSTTSKPFTPDHEMVCVEALLTSIVSFLKYCSELLLSIPDALSRTSLLLENLLPLFYSKGRLGSTPTNLIAISRLESAKASILEAFAWLPPGSYPMIADSLFGFAAFHIQSAIANDVTCSILPSLISKEDMVLDAVSFSRSSKLGQLGGAKDLETDIICRTSPAADHGDRESACSFLGKPGKKAALGTTDELYIGSQTLGLLVREKKDQPPTVLHEVGTWRAPVDASCCSSIRLVDAAIQAFAATFGLKSGKEQHHAMEILQSLLPPAYFQGGRSDQDRSGKTKDNLTSAKNIVAVLLSCVMTLPMDESTHDVPIGLGPTWMKKASAIFFSILPLPSEEIRRAAAEGLGCLATLGVKEDMHFLQSSVVHSLDEVIAGDQTHGHGRGVSQEHTITGQSGGLLTLACMQRNTFQFTERRSNRSRLRGSPGGPKDDVADSFPTLQIMIRLLPFASCQFIGGTPFSARTVALYALFMLLEYSGKLDRPSLDPENLHLLKKAAEIVEDNFLSAWTAASQSVDHGNETEKIAGESSFLAVLLRLMTFLVPSLYHLDDSDPGVASRFSTMATIIMDHGGSHPVVQLEAMAFFEMLSEHQALLPPHSGGLKYFEHPILCSIPSLMANITPKRSIVLPPGVWSIPSGCLSSNLCLRGTLCVLRVLSLSQILVAEWSDMKIVSLLFAALEETVASTIFAGDKEYRNLAAPREAEIVYRGGDRTVTNLSDVLRFLLYLERSTSLDCDSVLLRYSLLSRSLLVGSARQRDNDEEDFGSAYTVADVIKSAQVRALLDLQPVLDVASPIRWQVKSIAVQVGVIALAELASKCKEKGLKLVQSAIFNPALAKSVCAKECLEANKSGSTIPKSILSLHVAELVASACVAATATVDQVELRVLQENSTQHLAKIIEYFGDVLDPDEADTSLLSEFTPQISASIKSALVAHEEKTDETCRLFFVGCDALRFFVRSRVTSDMAVLKRVIRPALFSKNEVPFFAIDGDIPTSIRIDHSIETMDHCLRSSLLVRVGKAWTLGNIPLGAPEISCMLEPDSSCLGAHAAALAIDGARLLIASNLSLCGTGLATARSQSYGDRGNGFFFFADISDISDHVKSALAKTWAQCAQTAVELLSKAIASNEAGGDVYEACKQWIKHLIPFLFAGLDESMQQISKGSNGGHENISWANSVDVEEVVCCCLAGVNNLASDPQLVELGSCWRNEIEALLAKVYKAILLPVLVPNVPNGQVKAMASVGRMATLVHKSCEVFNSLTASFSLKEDSSLLMALLDPLSLLQKGQLDLSNELVQSILAASLISIAGIINQGSSSPTLVNAMLNLLLFLSQKDMKGSLPQAIMAPSQELLRECLAHDSVTIGEHSFIATALAKARDWPSWSVAVTVKHGVAAEKSLLEVESALLNPSSVEEQLEALTAVRELVQKSPPPNAVVGRILAVLGAEVISVFRAYAAVTADSSAEILRRRAAACVDGIKILVATNQQFSADSSDEEMAEFLIMLFDAFILALRFNGLPNHPPPQGALSDATIGRMCAQTITHTARTTPLPFKSCMAQMKAEDRALLEFAVRAEMNGYIVAAQPAPSKKKLSLKGFKK